MEMEKVNGKDIIYKTAVTLFWISLMVLIPSCSFTTAYIQKETLSLLKENQTTKAEVIQLLGKPIRTTSPRHSEKGEVLVYDYAKAKNVIFSHSLEMERQTITLFIDNVGILRKVCVNEGLENMAKTMGVFISPKKIALLKSKENQATKAEVIDLLGKPDWIWPGEEGKGEILGYFRAKSKTSFADNIVPIAVGGGVWAFFGGIAGSAVAGAASGVMDDKDYTSDKEQRINLFIDDEDILRKIAVNDKPIKMRGNTVGDYIEPAKLSLLKENQTTRTEVIELIGKPDYIGPGKEGKGEYFSYYYSREGIFTEEKRQMISLVIDDTGILREITVSEKLPK
jgi:outer membrane protein assembly factor BamE (lipoprotein component of BamABCDE complex)